MQSITPDPDAEFLHGLLPDVKSMTAKQKRTFKIRALNLMDEILEDTGSDQQSSTELSESIHCSSHGTSARSTG
jgi:hypothetical protein